MFLTPLNYSFPLQLVPVFEWEPVLPTNGASAPPSAFCQGTDTPQTSADTSSSPTDWKLVFKGYEWQSVGEHSAYPREDWESVLRSEADAREEERDPIAHRNEPARHQAPPRPSHAVSNDMHGTEPTQDKTDSSEPA